MLYPRPRALHLVMDQVAGTDRSVLDAGCAGLIGWVVLNLGMLKYKLMAGAPTGNELWPILLLNIFQVRTRRTYRHSSLIEACTPPFASD